MRPTPTAPRPLGWLAVLLAGAAALASCTDRGEDRTRRAIFAREPEGKPPAPVDPGKPLEALRLGAGDAAARAGSFAWEARVEWTVARQGATTVRVAERHRLRQLASGEFDLASDLDPGEYPGSETGARVVFAGGVSYARGRWSPFRERRDDRGQEARRQRDATFRTAADLAALYGPAFTAQPSGEVTLLGRRARRFVLALGDALPKPAATPAELPGGAYDPDTQRRVDFIQGRVPLSLQGELLVDAETGVPLRVALTGAFSQANDPQVRADVDLLAQVTALGAVAAVTAPPRALPDERKPRGVASALEAAGLRKPTAKPAPEEEAPPEDEEPSGPTSGGR